MKKLFLTLTSVLTILFTQAQCQAYFGYIQNGPTTVFTDSSTMQSTNYSATWFWDFGDGNTSAQQNPIHTYSNGIYSACLTVIFFDSTIMNYCTSIYCDSLLVGNGLPVSWDCGLIGCYDPGTGIGQYTTLSSCQSICGNVTDSFACMGGVAPGITTCVGPGIYTMGQTYVMAVYSTMAACIADSCNVMPPLASWDCSPNLLGCYDPGTGLGQYTTLSSCQSNCSSTTSNYCDSMTASGSQFQITMGINNINTIIDYWVTTAPNGAILQEDSIANTHTVYQNTQGMPYDTIITCITYPDPVGYYTCCVTWVWNGSFWANMGSVTSVGEINYTDKKLIKIVDVLGRETFPKSNENLFYIYDDGTVEKRIVIE